MQTRIITSTNALGEFVDRLRKKWGVVALDCETEPFGKNDPLKSHAWQLKLDGIGVYTPDDHAYIPSEVLLKDPRNSTLGILLREKVIVMHNAKFDVTVLEAQGFDVSKMRYHDTMVMGALADENLPSLGLKNLAQDILGVDPKDIVRFKDIPEEPEDPEEKKAWRQTMANYCMDDCRYTFDLYGVFMKSICDQDLLKVYEDLERPFTEVLRVMERRGIALDMAYMEEMRKKLEKAVKEAQDQVFSEAGAEFNIGSTPQLRKLLFEDRGHTLPKDFRTPKGEMSTDKEALTYLAKEQNEPLAQLILKYREYSKLLSTYVDSIGAKAVPSIRTQSFAGGPPIPTLDTEYTIHTTFWQTGTTTGRLSSSDPNLQNIGSREDEYNIRRAFIARPGCSFVTADYSQIELRLMAYFSGAKLMIQTYKNNGDIHKDTADAIGCARKVAKAINFGINYGLSPYGLSRNLKADGFPVSEEDAEGFINGYFSKFPEVGAFMAKCVEEVQKTGMVKDLFGRRRRFPEYAYAVRMGDDPAIHRVERQATNAVIQGSASSIIKRAMIKIHDRMKILGGNILLQIHDELVVEVPDHLTEEASSVIKLEMETAADLGEVPLVTVPKVTKVWAK